MRKIKALTIHHAAVHQEDLSKAITSFNRTHKERLHPTANSLGYHIAYHYVIGWKGDMVQTRLDGDIGYINGTNASNRESLGVCLVGDFDSRAPSKEQIGRLIDLIDKKKREYPGLIVNGHNDIDPSKTCPGKNFPLDNFKILYGNHTDIMSIFKDVRLKEVPENERLFTVYDDDSRPLTVQDAKFLFDIGFLRDNKRDRAYVKTKILKLFTDLKALFGK